MLKFIEKFIVIILNKNIQYLLLALLFNSCLKDFNIYEYGINKKTLIIDACITNVPKFDSSYYKYWGYVDSSFIVIEKDTFPLKKEQFIPIPFQSIYEASDSYVRIKWSNAFNQIENYTDFIIDAKVILKDDMGNVDTMRVPGDPQYTYFGNRYPSEFEYKLQGKVIPQAGHTYFLQVIYNNKIYTASTTIPLNRPTLDSIKSIFNRDISGRGIFINESGSGFSNIDFLNKSTWKTALYFKDIPNEHNYYIIKDPFMRFRLDQMFTTNIKLNKRYYLDNSFEDYPSDIWLGLDGFNTNVISDDFLSPNYGNEVYGFLGTWNGRNAIQDAEIFFGLPGNVNYEIPTCFSNYFASNTPRDYLKGLYKPDYQMNREIFFGTIDKNTYNYFYKAKELYKNDGGNFTPSPVTPASNFNNGVQGYFYGVNCFAMSFLGGKAFSNGIQIMDYNYYSHIFQESYLAEYNLLNKRYELPAFKYPFNTFK